MEDNQSQPLKEIRVLLVEDETDIADLLMFILQRAGAAVTMHERTG
ncbi:response regulator transcription factor [Leptolyngbya sp. FACHB-17]|nr:response regulator transcription factor [Leptolyngbya sp. FACHB-17]MBD2078336.1 response regulator transcription factor [Leptolyngbya sp. FACHB-17]